MHRAAGLMVKMKCEFAGKGGTWVGGAWTVSSESWLQGHSLFHGGTSITLLDTRVRVLRVFRDLQIVTHSF